jgi:hypothetical protein
MLRSEELVIFAFAAAARREGEDDTSCRFPFPGCPGVSRRVFDIPLGGSDCGCASLMESDSGSADLILPFSRAGAAEPGSLTPEKL